MRSVMIYVQRLATRARCIEGVRTCSIAFADAPGRFSLNKYQKSNAYLQWIGTHRGPEQSIRTMFNNHPIKPVPMTGKDVSFAVEYPTN